MRGGPAAAAAAAAAAATADATLDVERLHRRNDTKTRTHAGFRAQPLFHSALEAVSGSRNPPGDSRRRSRSALGRSLGALRALSGSPGSVRERSGELLEHPRTPPGVPLGALGATSELSWVLLGCPGVSAAQFSLVFLAFPWFLQCFAACSPAAQQPGKSTSVDARRPNAPKPPTYIYV